MIVKINGNDVDLEEGSSIKEAIDVSNAPYDDGSIVCLIRSKKEFEENINKYKIKTPKGSIIIEMVEAKEAKPLVDFWKKQYKDFEGCAVRWTSSNEVAFGPTTIDLEPTMDENSYQEGDVILSLSGFSNESTHIILAKENHSGVYGVPAYNKGVFAKIVGGRRTVRLLDSDDKVFSIEGVIERTSVTDSVSVSDLSTVLEEGNQLFTYLMLRVDENSPQSAEHLFSLIEKSSISVDYEANSFISFHSLQGLGNPKENITMRKRGTVTVRNAGKGIGKVYIYKEERVESPFHTTVAYIEEGVELLDIAKFNDKITMKSNLKRIMTLSMTQKESENYLKSIAVSHEKTGVINDDAVVVEQNPEFSIDIIKEGKVTTKGINKEDLALIELYDKEDEAPRSSWYFKKITGLIEKPIGVLKVHFAFPGMKISIFEGDARVAKGLIPENTPKSSVSAGQIGVTNMSKKNAGLIGVRFENSDEFGPTAEPFNATNIIGKIKTDLEAIEKIKEGKLLYIQNI